MITISRLQPFAADYHLKSNYHIYYIECTVVVGIACHNLGERVDSAISPLLALSG